MHQRSAHRSLLVIGSVALDDIDGPFGMHRDMLGGSASFIARAASYFTKNVAVVAVIGDDFPKKHVDELTALGVRTAGFSGADASTLVAKQHPAIDGVSLGHVGKVTRSSPLLLQSLLGAGILPVVSSVAQGPMGTLLNVNADTAATAIAKGLGAVSLHFITDVAGLLDSNGNVIAKLTADEARAYLASDIVTGGMKPKLEAAINALDAGVTTIAIGGGTELVAA